MTKEVIDLRSALELLESIPGQMVHTDEKDGWVTKL